MNQIHAVFLFPTKRGIHRIVSDLCRWDNVAAPKTCDRNTLNPEHLIAHTCAETALCTSLWRISPGKVPVRTPPQGTPGTGGLGQPAVGCAPHAARRGTAWATLTRTTSSSLFLCMSCFSSSTILDMASFSVSCSFSDNCKGWKGKLGHNTGPLGSAPRLSASVAQGPKGACRSPACAPPLFSGNVSIYHTALKTYLSLTGINLHVTLNKAHMSVP